jgi:hypothetical protein
MAFRDTSIHLTTALTKQDKQSNGIFFTPKDARDALFAILQQHAVSPTSILEPSFGSGEFLEDAYARYPRAVITGVELHPQLFQSVNRPNVYNMDFLQYRGKHDLILGNPPYVVIPKTADTDLCQTGRPNLFVQFLYKSIHENLNPNGYLAFVLPTSFFNCVYYEPMRRYLLDHTTVLAATPLTGKYIDTAQTTFALVLQKKKTSDEYFVQLNGRLYLTPFYREVRTLCVGSKTLSELGYAVKTGDVVWNQEKDKLSDAGVLLIYSSNFSTGTLVLGNLKLPKKQYIAGIKKPCLSGKTILVNRGYGNSTYKMISVIADFPAYYAENHVNIIQPKTETAKNVIERVRASLNDPRTARFIEWVVGNGALSKSEIETCLPIWLD